MGRMCKNREVTTKTNGNDRKENLPMLDSTNLMGKSFADELGWPSENSTIEVNKPCQKKRSYRGKQHKSIGKYHLMRKARGDIIKK